MSAKTLSTLAGLACLAASAQAQTGKLFVGENGSDPNNLPYCFETTLDAGFPGSVSWIPTYQFAIQGAACTPQNRIYLTTGVFQTDLYETVPGHAPVLVGPTSVAIFDMGYVNGKLYGWAQYASPSGIYEINPATGACTLAVASSSELFFALDGNPADGLLYAYSEYGQSGLYSINPTTGVKHRISTGPVGSFPNAYGMYRGIAVGNNTVYLTNVWNADPADSYYAYDLAQGDNASFVAFTNPYANSTPQLGGAYWYDPNVIADPPYPPNDLPADATPVGEGTFDFNTGWARNEGDSVCAGGATFNDVWFLYTPTHSFYAQFSTVNSATNFDTLMSLYAPDLSVELACSDDSGNYSLGSTIGYSVTAGVPILIRIAGWDYGPPSGIQSGPGQLTIGDCPDLSITTQPVDGYITRCMATANENGSEGPFYVIVSTEIDPHIGNFTFSWFNDGVPVESTYAGTFAVRSTLVQTNGFFSRVILIRPDARDAGHYQCLISSDDACDSPLSAATNIVTVSFCPADFDCDGTADFFDYDAFVTCFEDQACTSADFDNDGTVDFFDYDAFVQAFEAPC